MPLSYEVIDRGFIEGLLYQSEIITKLSAEFGVPEDHLRVYYSVEYRMVMIQFCKSSEECYESWITEAQILEAEHSEELIFKLASNFIVNALLNGF